MRQKNKDKNQRKNYSKSKKKKKCDQLKKLRIRDYLNQRSKDKKH